MSLLHKLLGFIGAPPHEVLVALPESAMIIPREMIHNISQTLLTPLHLRTTE